MSPRRYAWYHPRRWSSLLVFVVTLLAAFVVSGIIAAIGVRLAGSLSAWQAALEGAAPLMLVWRLMLYGVIAWLWLWRWKPRVVATLAEDSDGGEQAIQKLKRLEFVSLGFIVVIELINITNKLGGV